MGRLRSRVEEHAAAVHPARARGDAAAARAERARHRQGEAHRADATARRGAEGDGSQSRAHRRRQRAARRSRHGASSAPTRPRSSPRRPTTSTATRSKTARNEESRRRRRAAEGDRGRSAAAERAESRSAEDRGRAHRAAGRARQVHLRSRPAAEGDRSGQLRAEPPEPRRHQHRAELHQGLLPQRAAARLHGADADGASGRHAERRRRRELRARDEDGSVHDVPPGHRSARLREVSAAVPDASEPVGLRRQRLAASAGDDRLHRVPPGARRLDELQRRVALSEQCEAAAGVGREVPLARAAHVGLPDAADEHDGSVVRAVPSAGNLRSERAEARRRVCDVRARGLLRVPQDEGLRESAEARTDPDEDQRQADAGLGEELGARSVRHQERHLDAEGLVQLEQQRAGRPPAQRGGDQRGGRVSVREQRDLHAGRRIAAARRSEGGRADRALDRVSRLPHHRRERSRGRRPAPHVRPAAEERRQQDDLRLAATTGFAIRSTTTPARTCPTCGSPIRRWPTWRRI